MSHTSTAVFGCLASKVGVRLTLCTGLMRNVISHYIDKVSVVYGCFIDGSKAFDLVDHGISFQMLLDSQFYLYGPTDTS